MQTRKSIRLPEFNYTQFGYSYFITICTFQGQHILGSIANGEMLKNEVGNMIQNQWELLTDRFSFLKLDQFIIMPNHFHGIVSMVGDGVISETSLTEVVGTFKSLTTREINKTTSAPVKLWQRNYYEHIIRDENSMNRIRQYIISNPQNWNSDIENPNRILTNEFYSWIKNFKGTVLYQNSLKGQGQALPLQKQTIKM